MRGETLRTEKSFSLGESGSGPVCPRVVNRSSKHRNMLSHVPSSTARSVRSVRVKLLYQSVEI